MRNQEMLLIPGPTPVVDSIYDAIAKETWSHTDPRFAQIYKDSIAKTRDMLKTDGEVIVFAASGTLGMEMALINTVKPGEKVLVVSQGYFGDRFIGIGKAYGIEIDVIQSEWGQQVSPEVVEEKLASGNYKAVTVTHADTSTGVKADLDALVPVIKKHGALVIVDGICATAAMEEDMSKTYGDPSYKLDIVLTGSQKAIGVPPGLAIVAFNQSALDIRKEIEHVPGYYTDIYNWLPIMHDPTKYFATPAVNLVYAYDEGMRIVLEEGMKNRYARHDKFAEGVRKGLKEYGMKPLAAKGAEASTLSCVLYPEGVDDAAFRKNLSEKGIVVAGALAHLKGKAFRIGHMGNTTKEMLEKAVEEIGKTLNDLGQDVDPKQAVASFNSVF